MLPEMCRNAARIAILVLGTGIWLLRVEIGPRPGGFLPHSIGSSPVPSVAAGRYWRPHRLQVGPISHRAKSRMQFWCYRWEYHRHRQKSANTADDRWIRRCGGIQNVILALQVKMSSPWPKIGPRSDRSGDRPPRATPEYDSGVSGENITIAAQNWPI